jgi:hypothetical protein
MGGNSDNDLGLMAAFTKLGPLLRLHFGHGGDPVINALECVGETGARCAHENMKTPRLSETVGGRPMSVFEDFEEKFASNFAAVIHQGRFDGTPRTVGKIGGHG